MLYFDDFFVFRRILIIPRVHVIRECEMYTMDATWKLRLLTVLVIFLIHQTSGFKVNNHVVELMANYSYWIRQYRWAGYPNAEI